MNMVPREVIRHAIEKKRYMHNQHAIIADMYAEMIRNISSSSCEACVVSTFKHVGFNGQLLC